MTRVVQTRGRDFVRMLRDASLSVKTDMMIPRGKIRRRRIRSVNIIFSLDGDLLNKIVQSASAASYEYIVAHDFSSFIQVSCFYSFLMFDVCTVLGHFLTGVERSEVGPYNQ